MVKKVKFDVLNWDEKDLHNASPVITAKIDMFTVTLLIDTGASISFIDEKFVKKHTYLKHMVTKCTDGGYNLEKHTEANITSKELVTKNFKFGRALFEHRFVLAKLDGGDVSGDRGYDAIIGFDFLKKYKMCIDFHTQVITFHI